MNLSKFVNKMKWSQLYLLNCSRNANEPWPKAQEITEKTLFHRPRNKAIATSILVSANLPCITTQGPGEWFIVCVKKPSLILEKYNKIHSFTGTRRALSHKPMNEDFWLTWDLRRGRKDGDKNEHRELQKYQPTHRSRKYYFLNWLELSQTLTTGRQRTLFVSWPQGGVFVLPE